MSTLPSHLVCPVCAYRFPPEDILGIGSRLGDPVAGPEALRRFRPSRFTAECRVVDPLGAIVEGLACPRCHMEIPRAHLDMLAVVVSMVGAPASGKSHLLAAMTSQLRRLASTANLLFTDADPRGNAVLHGYEDRLFFARDDATPVEIAKTQLHGADLYQEVLLNGSPQRFPRPFQFLVSAAPQHPRHGDADLRRILVCYDTAGEHFQPAYRDQGLSVTENLGRSACTLVVIDPTQEPQAARAMAAAGIDTSSQRLSTTAIRQDVICAEMAWRVRRSLNLPAHARDDRPLVLAVSKADIWGRLIGWDGASEPVSVMGGLPRLDLARLRETSDRLRTWLAPLAPQIVATIEGLSARVLWLPVSSLGASPSQVQDAAGQVFWGIRPRDVAPRWASVPLLWALHQRLPGLIGAT